MPKLIDKIEFRIENGKNNKPHDLMRFYSNINLNRFLDGVYRITIEKLFRQRSINENAFYWGPFMDDEILVLRQAGWIFANKDELHEWNKKTFNQKEIINEQTGEIDTYAGSTRDLETFNFEDYLEKIRIKFREMFNAKLPYPNE